MTQSSLKRRLQWLSEPGSPRIAQGLQGIEKESLRVTTNGRIAQTPHPNALGAKLTHPSITTDYSEALMEFITQPQASVAQTLDSLHNTHAVVYNALSPELLWATSMPCVLENDPTAIPIADYGSSNSGMMKHIYRRGLGWRYGRAMQAISGVHFNYSLPLDFWPAYQQHESNVQSASAFVSAAYFGLTRNFLRYGWIIPYLFGASPAVCKSFLQGAPHDFSEFDHQTLYEPFATSLRMSDIGYKNKNQAHLHIGYNSLDEYVHGLTDAILTPEPEYERIGLTVDGQYRQLNTNILQIENEYYSFIRPKNVAHSGERPTLALQRRGVKYIEVRALDVNVFDPCGVSAEQLRFLEAFLILCLLEDSPPTTRDEVAAINRNQSRVARRGRQPDLELEHDGQFHKLRDWGRDILRRMVPIVELLNQQTNSTAYTRVLENQTAAIVDADKTPSARVLQLMRDNNESFFDFSLRMSEQHREYFRRKPLTQTVKSRYDALAAQSLKQQTEIEAADTIPFDAFLKQYFTQR